MPLIRRGAGKTETTAPAAGDAAAQLQDADANVRWAAARALGADAGAVGVLAGALAAENAAQVREAIFTSLVQIRTAESAAALAEVMRSDVAALRTGAIDALTAMPDVMRPLVPELLADVDGDVRVLACELVRTLEAGEATRLLSALLDREADANVCGAAVDVLSELGTAEAVGALKRCKARFAGEAYLGFAIDDVIARVGG